MSLQVWLPLNRDLSNYGLCNVPTRSISSASVTTNGGGKLGNCLSLSSDGQAVSLDSYMDVCSTYTRYSMSAWVYMSSTATNHSSSILSSGDWNSGSSQLCFGLYSYSSDGYYKILVPNKSSWSNGISLSSPIKLNTWYNICIIYDGNSTRGYVNGEYVGSYAGGGITSSSNSRNLYVGSATYYNGFTLKGSMNDVRIYDHCLSAKEVNEISKGLVCHYKLDNKGFGNPNLITTMSSGGRMTLNGKYGLNADFSQNTDTYGYFNVSPALELDSTYTLSFNVSNFPVGSTWNFKLWNNANYDIGTITKDGHYIYTFVPSESKLPSGYNLTKFLFDDGGRTNPVGMVYFTNFKIEKGSVATSWCPHTSDSLHTSLGLNSTIESDCSGNGYNGTLSEPLPYASNSPRYNGCYYFNSTSKRITLPTINMSGFSNSFSIAWWGKAPSYSSLMYWGFSNGNRLNYYSGMYCNTGDGSSNPYYKPNTTTTISAPSVDTWHHFVMVGDGSSNKLYMDGELYGVAATYKRITGSTIVINGWDSSTSYKTNGYISDFRIYSTVLSASDVRELYSTAASVDKNGNMYAYEFKEE